MVSKFFKCLSPNNNLVKITSICKNGNFKFFYTTKQNFSACASSKDQKDSSKCNNEANHEKNLAAVLHKKNDLRIETIPIPKINDDQVLIQIEVVGLSPFDANLIQNSTNTKPIIIGHEASGLVVECGKCVKKLKPGDKVAIEPHMGCMKCYACKTGHYNLCKKTRHVGYPPLDGVLCRYFAYDAEGCHKLPCNLDFEDGCLLQPFSMIMHAIQRTKLTGSDIVLVSSANTLGLLGLLVAKTCVSNVVVIDKNDYNLKKATELGSTCTINVKGLKPRDVRQQVEEVMGRLPNKALVCSGDEEMIQTSMYTIKSAGQVTLIGLDKKIIKLPLKECYWRMTNLVGSYRSCNDYPRSIHIINSGGVDPKSVVSHHFKLEETVKAFEFAKKKTEPFLKIMIHCNPEWRPKC